MTGRKQNICFRTYRLRARCVLEMFCAYLTTRGGEKATPMLLITNGLATPKWISPLECQKLAVGMSTFECCESNHTKIEQCRRSIALTILQAMIKKRVRSLFQSNNYAEARGSLCLTHYWCRGLSGEDSEKTWSSLHQFKRALRWHRSRDDDLIGRESFPLLA